MAAINLPSNLAFSFVMWTRIQKANNFASTIPLRSLSSITTAKMMGRSFNFFH
jgi:hypothetical protein